MSTTMQSEIRRELARTARVLARMRREARALDGRRRAEREEMLDALDADWDEARKAIALLERSHGEEAEAASRTFAEAWTHLISRLREVGR